MQLERFKLGKGFTKDGKTEYIEVEVKLPEGATDKVFAENFMTAEYLIDSLMYNMLDVKKPDTTPSAPAAIAPLKLLMSPEEFEAQVWKASSWVRKDDQDRHAKVGEDGFIPKLAADKRLIKMIDEAPNNKLVFPPYDQVAYSGLDNSLIVRRGPKSKKK